MRILGLDVGERRIGVAAADSRARVALPIGVVERIELVADVAAIGRLIQEHKAEALVLGLPISLNGTLGPQAEIVRAFGDHLAARLGLPVEYWDERLSTVEAQRRLVTAVPGGSRAGQNRRSRSPKSRRERRSGNLDALAAAIVLQSYLDRHSEGGPPSAAQG